MHGHSSLEIRVQYHVGDGEIDSNLLRSCSESAIEYLDTNVSPVAIHSHTRVTAITQCV